MIVYHLVIIVHTNRYGELCEVNCYFSDVFPRLDLAVKQGIKEVEERMQGFYKDIRWCEKAEFEEFIAEYINYQFRVHEFDLQRKNGTIRRRTDIENITFDNSIEFADEIEWEYNHKGELIRRTEWRNIGIEMLESDYEQDAGTHFKKGDLVTIKGSNNDTIKGIYVVAAAPGRRGEAYNPLTWQHLFVRPSK